MICLVCTIDMLVVQYIFVRIQSSKNSPILKMTKAHVEERCTNDAYVTFLEDIKW